MFGYPGMTASPIRKPVASHFICLCAQGGGSDESSAVVEVEPGADIMPTPRELGAERRRIVLRCRDAPGRPVGGSSVACRLAELRARGQRRSARPLGIGALTGSARPATEAATL